MSKRSEKEARTNANTRDQLVPVLIVTAMLSYFQYRKLKKQYLASSQAKRIDDPESHIPTFAISAIGTVMIVWWLYSFAKWTFAGHAAYAPVLAIAVYGGWLVTKWLLRAQAACLLGVVVDVQSGTLTFPTFWPALTTLPLMQVQQMTREDGNKLHIAGEFGSHTLTFSDKRRRDECIYLLKAGTAAAIPAEME